MKVLEMYERSLTGEKVSEKEYDMKLLPAKLKELIQKYEIHYPSGDVVPQDKEMGKRAYEAAVELLTDLGVYCNETNSIIRFDRSEIADALVKAPKNVIVGEGVDGVELRCRSFEDKRRPHIAGGTSGAPCSETNFIDIMASYAKESDILHTATVTTLFGMPIRAGSPIEIMVVEYELLWAREAIRRAGKPGMAMVAPMSGVTSESQTAGYFVEGMRPTDLHLLAINNDLKLSWHFLKEVAYDKHRGHIIDAASNPVIGGYSGGPEGTALVWIAEIITGFVCSECVIYSGFAHSLRFFVTRPACWANCMGPFALNCSGVQAIVGLYCCGAAGPCTDVLCDELSAQAIAKTVAGASALYGGTGSEVSKLDYETGMEARILSEVSRATAGKSLEEGNEIAKKLFENYEDIIKSGKTPAGKSFTDCYERSVLKPTKEYLDLWSHKKEFLEKLGLTFD